MRDTEEFLDFAFSKGSSFWITLQHSNPFLLKEAILRGCEVLTNYSEFSQPYVLLGGKNSGFGNGNGGGGMGGGYGWGYGYSISTFGLGNGGVGYYWHEHTQKYLINDPIDNPYDEMVQCVISW